MIAFLEKQSKLLKISFGFSSIGIVGLLDLWTGYEIDLSLFYVLPVSFLAWFFIQPMGLAAAAASATVWLWADVASGHLYSLSWVSIWNSLIRLAFFAIIVLLLASLRKAVEQERALARIDSLTGAVNNRFFNELTHSEIGRLQRFGHHFSIAYLDLDNFKIVNDRWGHAAGNDALRTVVNCIQNNIRRTDVIARLGGDEFALLLPETDVEMVRSACEKIQKALLKEMRAKKWPVTFSIGVLTCQMVPPSVDVLVSRADELMYAVKQGSKNDIKYDVYKG